MIEKVGNNPNSHDQKRKVKMRNLKIFYNPHDEPQKHSDP